MPFSTVLWKTGTKFSAIAFTMSLTGIRQMVLVHCTYYRRRASNKGGRGSPYDLHIARIDEGDGVGSESDRRAREGESKINTHTSRTA